MTQRLSGFERQLVAIHQSKPAPQQINIRREDLGVAVKEIDLDLPDGTSLLRGVAFASARGEALLIEGPTGAGKSTIAGIWPFGCGEIRLGNGRMLFVPQRPYLPLGTLCQRAPLPTGR